MQDLQNPSILIIQWLRKIIHIFWLALRLVHEVKRAKQANTCLTHGFDFAYFNFSRLGSLGPSLVVYPPVGGPYRELSRVVKRGVGEQLAHRLSPDCGWGLYFLGTM